MANKKLKYPVPTVKELWEDAIALLHYANRLEQNSKSEGFDESEKIMLSDCHQAFAEFRRIGQTNFSNSIEVQMISKLAKVYHRVAKGELKKESDYREALLKEFPLIGGNENSDDPNEVPGILLMDKKTIAVEGGPVEAAAASIGELYDRSPRQLMEYRARAKKGKLKGNIFEIYGSYKRTDDFSVAVLKRVFKIEDNLAKKLSVVLSKLGSSPF